MDFYDDLAPLYQLIFPDSNSSIKRQGEQLDRVIQSEWPGHRTLLDVSCGIGTQALALAARGYSVVGADLSPKEIERARREEERGTNLVKHYGARVEDGKRYVLFQVWDFDGDHYDLAFFVVEDAFYQPIIVGSKPAK